LVSAPDRSSADQAFRPSDYTAALLRQLLRHAEWVRGARVLDAGCGSGVLLAAAGALGATAVCGVDIEADAVTASAAASPDEALRRLLDDARASLPGACGAPGADGLIRVLCAHEIRVGIRRNYPLFATHDGDQHTGYDIDVARAIANRLGVGLQWVYVRAAARISTPADGGCGRGNRHDGSRHRARRGSPVHSSALLPLRDDRRRPPARRASRGGTTCPAVRSA
jgi:SAM-dependent methyltransferase